MGLLDIFSKPKEAPKIEVLPKGSFTVDRTGKVVASTLPTSFPEDDANEIGKLVLNAFQSAKTVKLSMTALAVNYGAWKITAREQRGGAMIFLAPR